MALGESDSVFKDEIWELALSSAVVLHIGSCLNLTGFLYSSSLAHLLLLLPGDDPSVNKEPFELTRGPSFDTGHLVHGSSKNTSKTSRESVSKYWYSVN